VHHLKDRVCDTIYDIDVTSKDNNK
jgi:hypothetical protein